MKKVGMILCLLLTVFFTAALADGELSVTQTACSIVSSGETCFIYCYAQVHNNTSQVVSLHQGTLTLMEGNTLIAAEDVGRMWPAFLNAGMDGFLFDVVTLESENGEPINAPGITAVNYDLSILPRDAGSGNFYLDSTGEITEHEHGALDVECYIENHGEGTAWSPTVTCSLYTSGGSMIYADAITLDDVGVLAGEGMGVRFHISSILNAQWHDYGAYPAEVRIQATYRDEQD